jgi:uncharacterized NAD-dependent epimerase/dehydratase family protein
MLLLAEGHSDDPHHGKTALGVLRYARDTVVAVLDSEREGSSLEGIPVVATVGEALAYDPTVALVGVATTGGRFPAAWRSLLRDCAAAGLDLESGLHERLSADPELVELASRHGVELRDLRVPPEGLDVPTGANLTHPARVVLTIGTDCAIGKMTVALELDREARRRGISSAFVPTGQTGIAIAGWGISVDAVVADFIAGASERLVIEAVERGADFVVVEGQGSLLHPAYAGVTLGLLHGSAPHDLVLCHRAGQTAVDGDERFAIPPLMEVADLYERVALLARRPRVRAIALNTRGLDDAGARAAVDAAEAATGLPATDPVRFGAGRLLDALVAPSREPEFRP